MKYLVILLFLLLPVQAFAQGSCNMTSCEKITIQGNTGVDISNKGAGPVCMTTTVDGTKKGFCVAATTGELTPVGGAGISGTIPITGAVSVTSLTTTTTVAAGTTVTAGTGITATTGAITATAGAVVAGTTVTAGTGVTATTGAITATAGALVAGTTVTAGTGITATLGDITATNGNVVFSAAQKGVKDNIATLAALGTNQATCAPVITTIARVTAADGTVGVCLPAGAAGLIGRKITIINSDVTSALKVYSTGSDTITGQAGSTAISVAAKVFLECTLFDATNWYCNLGVTPY